MAGNWLLMLLAGRRRQEAFVDVTAEKLVLPLSHLSLSTDGVDDVS